MDHVLVRLAYRKPGTGDAVVSLKRAMTPMPAIILVDDDPDKRFLLERFLRKNFTGYSVSSYTDCTKALGSIKTPTPKVVITNGRVAEEDGIAFAQKVTQEFHFPVIMVSLRLELRERAERAGVAAFVETGEYGEIKAAIENALQAIEQP